MYYKGHAPWRLAQASALAQVAAAQTCNEKSPDASDQILNAKIWIKSPDDSDQIPNAKIWMDL